MRQFRDILFPGIVAELRRVFLAVGLMASAYGADDQDDSRRHGVDERRAREKIHEPRDVCDLPRYDPEQ